MEIQALKVLITDQDVNDLITRELARHQKIDVRDLHLRFDPAGVYLSGVYDTRMMDLPFETMWELSVAQAKPAARLASFRPLGHLGGAAFNVVNFFSKGSLSHLLMQAIADALKGEDAFAVQGETITCDLERLLAKNGWPIKINLAALRCQAGQLVVEAGTPVP